MKISVERDALLTALQRVSGVVERRQTLPILANVLFNVSSEESWVTAYDHEVQLKARVELEVEEPTMDFTVPARKMLDICRALPEGVRVTVTVDGDRAVMASGRSRFTLGVLPAEDYPALEPVAGAVTLDIPQAVLKRLVEKTQFAMAHQDVRYYLNGLLLEIEGNKLRAVATDGHRLAVSEAELDVTVDETVQVIVPRKGVGELARLLENVAEPVRCDVGANQIGITSPSLRFSSKLIDGRFPDYRRVIPQDLDKEMIAEREPLRQALSRAAILSNEKYRGVMLEFSFNSLQLRAHNPEQEEAEDGVQVEYDAEPLVIGYNVAYLLDVLSVIDGDKVRFGLRDSGSSCLVSAVDSDQSRYVVMPMRL